MDEISVAVVLQYWRRVRDFWTVIAQELADRLGHPVADIADPTLAFCVIANSEARRDEVLDVLEQIAVRQTPGISHRRLVSAAG
jgi:hypothetical protein